MHGVPAQPVEIACDESGYEGDKLIGATTDLFAHASVRLDVASAANCVNEIRRRIQSPAQEYKANHLLRTKHRPVLEWLLGALRDQAHVYLVDKEFFVVRTVAELMIEGDPESAALTLCHAGRGTAGWNRFLLAANDLLRAKDQPDVTNAFFAAVDDLRAASPPGPLDEVASSLARGRARAESFRAHMRQDPTVIPPLEALVPAIVAAVTYWGAGVAPVTIVHDRQTTLPDTRIAQLKTLAPALASVRFVDSRAHPPVQLADIIAGVVRKIASDELNGRGDATLTAMLPPYLDASSIWGDSRSWALLRPAD